MARTDPAAELLVLIEYRRCRIPATVVVLGTVIALGTAELGTVVADPGIAAAAGTDDHCTDCMVDRTARQK